MRRSWCPILLASMTALLPATRATADDPPAAPKASKFEVVSPKTMDVTVHALNEKGDAVGFEWVEDPQRPGVLDQKPFFARGKEMTYLPLLKGYTATMPAAVSDTGLVVGRAGRPAPPNVRLFMRNQAFVWDAKGGIRGLGVLPDDWASFATGISRDGRRICGYSVGDDRVRACVWDRDEAGDGWKGRALPQKSPMLGGTIVAISPDGLRVAGADGVAACLWTCSPAGEWTREVIAEDSALIPRAVNNAGTVVGLRYVADALTHAAYWSREDGCRLIPEPREFVKSEAHAINSQGVIVGFVDGPNGSEIGPRAFAFEGGRLHLMDEAGPFFVMGYAINDKNQVGGVFEKDEED